MAAATLLALACSNTKVVDSWKDPSREPQPLNRVVVVGLTDDAVLKRVFEDTFSASLRERGNDAVASYSFVSANAQTNPDSLVATLRTAGYTAALTARSLGEEMTETYAPGRSYYIPDYYYHWSSYYTTSYTTSYTTVGDPGYYERTQKVLVEANLFDLASERLIWAARSKTTKTGKLKESVADYNRAIIAELAKSGWIK
jgi:hypothetical protein